MKARLSAILLFALTTAAQANVIYVKPAGTGTGTSWQNPLGTVQAGINAASTGDELWIAAGTYTERVTLPSGVSLYGGFNATETSRDQRDWTVNNSILDGSGAGPVITVTGSGSGEIDGLTLQHGLEVRTSMGYGGDAIYAATAATNVRHCTIQDSQLEETILSYTGVVFIGGSGATVEYNVIRDNVPGGVYANAGTVSRNTITNCVAGPAIDEAALAEYNNVNQCGDGVLASDTVRYNVITNCGFGAEGKVIMYNWLANNTTGGGGGGSVVGNWVIGNNGYTGSGLRMESGGVLVKDNLIANNGPNGAGLYVQPSSGSFITVVNNTIVGNFRASQPDSTFRSGAGIAEGGSTNDVIVNNIIAFNDEGISTRSVTTLSPMLRNNDVYGNTEGNYVNLPDATGTSGNISADPKFVDYAHGNYHLQSTSPCIDTGDDSVVMAGDTDLDQAPRIVGPHVDMGAYESLSSLPFTFSQAVTAIRILGGLQAALPSDLQRLNIVASDTSANVVDIRDATRLVRKAAGLDGNP